MGRYKTNAATIFTLTVFVIKQVKQHEASDSRA